MKQIDFIDKLEKKISSLYNEEITKEIGKRWEAPENDI